MKEINALFVGMYPNTVSPYRNVFFQNLIFAMADMGVDCTVISPVPITKYRHKILNIDHCAIHETPKGAKVTVFYPWYVSASSKQIGSYNTERLSEKLFEDSVVKTIKKINKKFDFVYGHFFLYGGLAAIKIGRILNIPSFVAFGECDYESQIQKTYGDLKASDIAGLSGVISVSTKNAKKLDELGIFRDIPVIVAPNAVDKTLFKKLDRTDCRKELGLPSDKFIVGFVGGFIERKGDKRLLAAVNQLDGVYLAYAGVPGNGNAAPSGDRVLFCKPLKHEQVPVLLNAVDVFCLPTLSEGSCNAVAEALACGTPVISSNLSFNDDVLTDENSIRIDPSSVDEIRNAIGKISQNETLRRDLSTKAIEDSKPLDINNRAKRILDFIESCAY